MNVQFAVRCMLAKRVAPIAIRHGRARPGHPYPRCRLCSWMAACTPAAPCADRGAGDDGGKDDARLRMRNSSLRLLVRARAATCCVLENGVRERRGTPPPHFLQTNAWRRGRAIFRQTNRTIRFRSSAHFPLPQGAGEVQWEGIRFRENNRKPVSLPDQKLRRGAELN